MKETLTAKLYSEICEQYHNELKKLTAFDEDHHRFLTLNYDAINDSIYVVNGNYKTNFHVDTQEDWQPIYQQLEVLITNDKRKQQVMLEDFFQMLSRTLGGAIKPDSELKNYFERAVPMNSFADNWYRFFVNSEGFGTDLFDGILGEESGDQITVVPVKLLVDFLTEAASEEDRPAAVLDEFLNHIHMCADDDIIRHDVEMWVKEDKDAAIKGIYRPLEYGYAEYNDVKILVLLN